MRESPHWFWLGLAVAVLAWYTTVTLYVAVRGAYDIRHMLDELKRTPAAGRDAAP